MSFEVGGQKGSKVSRIEAIGVPEPEVTEKPLRRKFTTDYKLKILEDVNGLCKLYHFRSSELYHLTRIGHNISFFFKFTFKAITVAFNVYNNTMMQETV